MDATQLVLLVRARHVLPSAGSLPFASTDELSHGGHDSHFARRLTAILPCATVDGGPTWQLRALPEGPREALSLGVQVQLTSRTLPRHIPGDPTPALQPVVLVATLEEAAGPTDVWERVMEVSAAAGGQLLWTDSAVASLHNVPMARLYSWEARGPSATAYECLYGDRLSLLDAPFERMFAAEVDRWVGPRRAEQQALRDGRGPLVSPTRPAVENDLYGIALSGGGMRSATFSLGVMQALARYDMLEPADYLSTVSGGGYVGVSLAALCSEELPYQGLRRLGSRYETFPFAFPRERLGDADASDESASSEPVPMPVHGNETPALWHVRKYANLLGGGISLLDLSTWQSVGRYVASTLTLWLLFLIPALGAAVLLLAGLWHWLWRTVPGLATEADRAWLLPLLALHPVLLVVLITLLRLTCGRMLQAGWSDGPFPAHAPRSQVLRTAVAVAAGIVTTIVLAAAVTWGIQWAVEQWRPVPVIEGPGREWLRAMLVMTPPLLVLGAFFSLGCSNLPMSRSHLVVALLVLLVPVAAGVALYLLGNASWVLWITFFAGVAGAALSVAHWARSAHEAAGRRALNAIAIGAASLLLAMAVGAGVWLVETGRPLFGLGGQEDGHEFRWVLLVASGVGLVLVAISLSRLSAGSGNGALPRWLFSIGGYLVLASLAIFASWGAWSLWAGTVSERDAAALSVALLIVFALVLTFPMWVPIDRAALLNVLSLNGLYEDRLQQTWIIGARPSPADADGMDALPPDSVPKWNAVWSRPDLTVEHLGGAHVPTVPYPLICTALNIPGSRGEKLPERKADSFVIAPVYSGSALSRWLPTAALPGFSDMSLARASSISGAALSPNMGEMTSRSMSILTTMFNVRIGLWVRNPRQVTMSAIWDIATGGLRSLPVVLYIRELLGIANRDDEFVYLSDGGHFENLGVYELFRRRCRYIVAVSSDIESADGEDAMGNLGTALRMARVDFGVEVVIPTLKPLLRHSKHGRVLSYFAVGEIRYPDQKTGDGRSSTTGTFVFIKTGLVEDALPPDLIQYLAGNPSFPYDSTLDQQYDQPQFESYRQLGYLAGRAMCKAAAAPPAESATADRQGPLARRFQALRTEFRDTPAELLDVVRSLEGIREELSR